MKGVSVCVFMVELVVLLNERVQAERMLHAWSVKLCLRSTRTREFKLCTS